MLASIAVGSAAGGAVVALVLFAMSRSGLAQSSVAPGVIMPAFGPALAGGGGVLAGALVAWAISRPLGNAFQRAALAMMAVMGTALVAGGTIPAHALAGRAGLAAVALLCLGAMLVAWRLFLGGTD